MLESGWSKHGNKTITCEARWDHDGRLVPGGSVGQQAGGLFFRVLCSQQSGAVGEAVRRNRGGVVDLRGNPGVTDTKHQTPDGQGALDTTKCPINFSLSFKMNTLKLGKPLDPQVD